MLAVGNVARSLVVPDRAHLPFNVGLAAAVAAVGWSARLTADEVGAGRRHLPKGVRVGASAAVVVSGALAVGALLPATRDWLVDPRGDISASELAWQALVVIPVGTVVVEEVAFRGVLHGLLRRYYDTWTAVGVGALAFGAWHVLPAFRADGAAMAAATMVATTAAGVAFGWLRAGSGSLAAPILAHIATNSGALVAAWLVTR